MPDLDEDEGLEAPADKGPVQMTAEELADEGWGPVKDKKKGKKGKKGGKAAEDEEPEKSNGGLSLGLSLRHLAYLCFSTHPQRIYSRA